MKTAICKLLLMVLIISCVFSGVAAANRVYGTIYDDNGNPIAGKNVEIEKSDGSWTTNNDRSDNHGKYDAEGPDSTPGEAEYVMKVDGRDIDHRKIKPDEWHEDSSGHPSCQWDHKPPASIPEFPTVALPIASAIGLMFFFQYRKKKEE